MNEPTRNNLHKAYTRHQIPRTLGRTPRSWLPFGDPSGDHITTTCHELQMAFNYSGRASMLCVHNCQFWASHQVGHQLQPASQRSSLSMQCIDACKNFKEDAELMKQGEGRPFLCKMNCEQDQQVFDLRRSCAGGRGSLMMTVYVRPGEGAESAARQLHTHVVRDIESFHSLLVNDLLCSDPL